MEYFDILDRNANPVGRTAEMGTPPGEGMYYMGVNAYIMTPEGYFLLQRRSLNKKIRPGAWDILMGHVMAGETSQEAVLRETREETGLTPDEHHLRFIGRYVWDRAKLIADIYFMVIPVDLKALVLQRDEVMDAKLVAKDEMTAFVKKMTFHTKEYRNVILDAIGQICPEMQ